MYFIHALTFHTSQTVNPSSIPSFIQGLAHCLQDSLLKNRRLRLMERQMPSLTKVCNVSLGIATLLELSLDVRDNENEISLMELRPESVFLLQFP
jgi:hypothetical protein